MHDDNQVCVDELPDIIKKVKYKGWQFVYVSELMNYAR
jgi:peptidoglycan/xylan/chitin deacetylase (PgdA/CDA1 family)